MSQLSINKLWLKLEEWRLRQHFKRVEETLRVENVSHLSPDLQLTRKHYLDEMHHYAVSGIFPRNYERPGYSPCFIDRDRRNCAVAHLVIFSGHTEVAYKIAAVANYAYIPQMNFPELDDWTAQTGLSKEELSLIQPGYYSTFTGTLLAVALASWAAGLAIILTNAIQITRKRTGIVTSAIGLLVTAILLLLGLYCLHEAASAYSLGVNPDGLGFALHVVGSLNLGAVISLGLGLIAGCLSYHQFRRAKGNK